jgi:hypothetical protein
MRGQTVCKMHGGATPVAIAAGEERVAEVEAQRVVRSLWGGLDKAEAVTDPRRALQKLAGALTDMTDHLGADIQALHSVEAGDDSSRLRGKVLLFEKLLGHLRGTLTDMNRLGLAEQVVQLERDQARHVGLAVEDGLEAMGASPEQREVFVAAMMARLRREAGEA